MQSRWPFFFATLLLFLVTLVSLQVWVQEQNKARQTLLDSSVRKPISVKNNTQESARTGRTGREERTTRYPQHQLASGVTAKVNAVPYTQTERNPFQLPAASSDVYGDSPVVEPVATRNVDLDPPEQSAPEFESALPATEFDPTEILDDNPWAFDANPDLNQEPNSLHNNLEKLDQLLPPAEPGTMLEPLVSQGSQGLQGSLESLESLESQSSQSSQDSQDLQQPEFKKWVPEETIQPLDLADQSFQIDEVDQDFNQDFDQDFNQDFDPEPEVETATNPLLKFASTAKSPEPKLLSSVGPPRRPPSQPFVEIEIPEWDPYAAWPKPTAILEQLEELKKHKATKHWADETTQLLKLLHWTKSIEDPNAAVIFEQLSVKLNELDNLCVQISTSPVQSPEYAQGYLAGKIRTFHYDIARRIVLWSQMHRVAVQNQSIVINPVPEKNPLAQASRYRFVPPNLDPEWSTYLAMDELTESLNSLQPDTETQRAAARQTLLRFFSSALGTQQRQYLDPYFSNEFVGFLREKATGPVDIQDTLKLIEYHEKSPTGYSVAKMNDLYQSLLWSTDANSQQLATLLESHYRNANFRVSISDKFLNRLIPQQPEVNLPIQENVMGAQIRGNGRISNRLRIRLFPDNSKVNLRLEANGEVRSLTQAQKSGFTVDNQGHTRFKAFKNLAFSRSGLQADAAQAYSQTNSRVLRLRSELDAIPVVGWVARRIARDKIAASTPATEQLTNQKVQNSARQEIETQVDSRMQSLKHYLAANLMQPLIAMEMEPTAVETRTTHDRVIMRYRLAGRDQMAAHTARPRALADSLMSLQFHESLFNNLLERIDLKGNEFTAEELVQHLSSVFSSGQIGSKEIEADATFVFAPYDPLRIRFVDNKVEFSLNLKKFRIGKGKTWKNLSVTATYLPTATGMQLALTQDDAGISLKGSNLKLRDQIAVRTVFTALFEDRYELNILPPTLGEKFNASNLRISQLAITDGWIGLSLGEKTPVTIPYNAAGQAYPASNVPVYNFRR